MSGFCLWENIEKNSHTYCNGGYCTCNCHDKGERPPTPVEEETDGSTVDDSGDPGVIDPGVHDSTHDVADTHSERILLEADLTKGP